MSKLSRENTAQKLKGAGDGFKNLTRSAERIPFRSSRKFTPTLVRDESLQWKLKKELDHYKAKDGILKKSKSVAEITPTKSNSKKPKRRDVAPSSLLHATPRPQEPVPQEPPSGRDDARRRLELMVYHRLLLFVWRRSKARVAMLSEQLRRRQDQMCNLEKQVKCLKDLNYSEIHKRGEATGECQRMENVLRTLRTENNSLITEKVSLQTSLDDLQCKFQSLNIELENMKNEIHTKNMYMKKLENDILKERNVTQKILDENNSLVEKVKEQEVEIKSRGQAEGKLHDTLRELEKRLKEVEKGKNEEVDRLTQQCQQKARSHDCIRRELSRVCSLKDELNEKIRKLEDKLAATSSEYEAIFKENEFLKRKMQEKKRWWVNAKEFMNVSWAVLQHAAYLMLPAM